MSQRCCVHGTADRGSKSRQTTEWTNALREQSAMDARRLDIQLQHREHRLQQAKQPLLGEDAVIVGLPVP